MGFETLYDPAKLTELQKVIAFKNLCFIHSHKHTVSISPIYFFCTGLCITQSFNRFADCHVNIVQNLVHS